MQSKHKDPFDRIIAAQALRLDIPVLSVDSDLDTFAFAASGNPAKLTA